VCTAHKDLGKSDSPACPLAAVPQGTATISPSTAPSTTSQERSSLGRQKLGRPGKPIWKKRTTENNASEMRFFVDLVRGYPEYSLEDITGVYFLVSILSTYAEACDTP